MIDRRGARADAPEAESRSEPFAEDMPFQIRSWRVRGVAWTGLGITLVAALLGVFSVGPLSSVTLVGADGRLVVETQRFLRDGAAERITLRVDGVTAAEFEIVLDPVFEAGFDIEAMQPEPLRAFADDAGLHLFFVASPDARSLVELRIRPTGWGRVRSTLGVAGIGSVEMMTMIFP